MPQTIEERLNAFKQVIKEHLEINAKTGEQEQQTQEDINAASVRIYIITEMRVNLGMTDEEAQLMYEEVFREVHS
jgi:hypothetical protein